MNRKLDSIKEGVDKIRTATAPRQLTTDQQLKLRAIAQSLPEGALSVFFTEEDQENTEYSQQFVAALALEPKYMMVVYHSMPPIVGIQLLVSDFTYHSGQEPVACTKLRTFFTAEGIPFQAVVGKQDIVAPCELRIGEKPLK